MARVFDPIGVGLRPGRCGSGPLGAENRLGQPAGDGQAARTSSSNRASTRRTSVSGPGAGVDHQGLAPPGRQARHAAASPGLPARARGLRGREGFLDQHPSLHGGLNLQVSDLKDRRDKFLRRYKQKHPSSRARRGSIAGTRPGLVY